MSFLSNKIYKEINTKTHKLKSVCYDDEDKKSGKETDSFISPAHRVCHISERASAFASGSRRAVITVEAALAVPFFFLACVCLIYLLEVQAVRTSVKMGAYKAAQNAAKEMYAVPVVLPSRVEADIVDAIGRDRLERSMIVGKSEGLSCAGSRVEHGTQIVDIIVDYKVQPPIRVFGIPPIAMREAVRMKGWTGYEKGSFEEREGYVYITESGTVYHKNYNCTYLKLSIQIVPAEEVSGLRNEYQGKYYPCEKCMKNGNGGMVYIARTGNRYHSSLGCSGLKRSVRAVKLSEVGGRGACSRCGHS